MSAYVVTPSGELLIYHNANHALRLGNGRFAPGTTIEQARKQIA